MTSALGERRTSTAFLALMERESLRVLKIWTQTIAFPTISGLLYITVFGGALGSRIGRIDGVPYLEYMVPGIVLMQVATQAFNNNSASVFQARSDGYIEDVLAAPMHPWQVSIALLWGGLLRSLSVGALVLVLGFLLTDLGMVHPVQALLLLVATGVLWSSVGTIAGIWATSWDQHMLIGNLVIVPLVFVGGVFYSVDMLPPRIAWLTRLDPLFYEVQGLRHAFLGHSDSSFALAFGLTVALAAIAFVVQLRLAVTGWRLKD